MPLLTQDELDAFRTLYDGGGVDRGHAGVQGLLDRSFATYTEDGQRVVLSKDGREVGRFGFGWQRAGDPEDGRAPG